MCVCTSIHYIGTLHIILLYLCVVQRRERGGVGTEGTDSIRSTTTGSTVRGQGWALNW